MGIENTWKSDDISSQCKTTALVQLELAFISIAFFIFRVIRSSATMCFAKPSNHQLHCLKFGLNCHFNPFLSIDFQMTFIPSSPIALPCHECAVTNGIAGLSAGYNDLPLRQKSSSLHLRCNEGKEWIASLPPGSQKWALFKNSAISRRENLTAVRAYEPFTCNLINLLGRILVFGYERQNVYVICMCLNLCVFMHMSHSDPLSCPRVNICDLLSSAPSDF